AEIPDLPEPWRPWEKIDARADSCLGQKCERYDECFLTRMRRRAMEADLIVVNHHLLLSDLVLKASAYGAIIPEYRCLVVDEAHMLEEVATAHLGRSLSSHQVSDLALDAIAFAERHADGSPGAFALAAAGRELKATAAELPSLLREDLRGRFLLAP